MYEKYTHTLGLMAATIYAAQGVGEISGAAGGAVRRSYLEAAALDACDLLQEILASEEEEEDDGDDDAPAAKVA
jgi:hypothetical protein